MDMFNTSILGNASYFRFIYIHLKTFMKFLINGLKSIQGSHYLEYLRSEKGAQVMYWEVALALGPFPGVPVLHWEDWTEDEDWAGPAYLSLDSFNVPLPTQEIKERVPVEGWEWEPPAVSSPLCFLFFEWSGMQTPSFLVFQLSHPSLWEMTRAFIRLGEAHLKRLLETRCQKSILRREGVVIKREQAIQATVTNIMYRKTQRKKAKEQRALI